MQDPSRAGRWLVTAAAGEVQATPRHVSTREAAFIGVGAMAGVPGASLGLGLVWSARRLRAAMSDP